MQYTANVRLYVFMLNTLTKKAINDQEVSKQIKKTTQEIFLRAKDIGNNNTLLGSYILAAYFIAMNRASDLGPQKCYEIIDQSLRKSKLFKLMMGDAKDYFSEKHMAKRRAWSKETHQHRYANDWVVDVIEEDEQIHFGFNYHECGVCKLCKDEHCEELAKYLCRLDFMIIEVMGIKLKRTMTLAEGGEYCDFRFIK